MANPADVMLLAIETYVAGPKAIDTARDQVTIRYSGKRYSMREWAVDVISQLPPDQDRARQIVEAHHRASYENLDNSQRRRLGQYCGQFYRRLRERGLMQIGERFLEKMK